MSEEQPTIDAPTPSGCPVAHGRMPQPTEGGGNQDWWPNQLNLKVLQRNSEKSDPYAADFDYATAFKALDLDAVRADIVSVLTDSKEWWPADYGHYGPFFIRMAWHAAGTYRVGDGRGGAGHGQQRFAPLNSWPDNAGLDKARRLLWPVKKKYGKNLSWADLLVFAGNVALEDMGFKTFGFGGGRVDEWEPDEDVYWGPETEWLDDKRYTGERDLENPLAAVQMGLIYVNPEGPNGDPDPLKAAVDIRETFKRMAMDDTETLALIAGGHTFGKTHGNSPADTVGDAPEAAPLEAVGLGWVNSHGSGVGIDANSSGLEGAWNSTPKTWDNNFFWTLYGYEWELGTSPTGAKQWHPVGGAGSTSVPDAHDPELRHAPMMLTTDLALRFDPAYEKISRHFLENPNDFADAFARAWFKLTHRDMGPKVRYLGPEVPAEDLIWQDPIPAADYTQVGPAEIDDLKNRIRNSGLSVSQLVSTAWAAGSSFRGSDLRGGANGGRIRLAPQKDWEANEPAKLAEVITALEAIVDAFNASQTGTVRVSFADVVVLGGAVGIEQAAAAAGRTVTVPFTPGRADTTQELTDAESFSYLEPKSDGFRNYAGASDPLPAEYRLVDKASLLNLTAPEMTVLLGGLRVLGTNHGGSSHGVLTATPGVLTTDFFVNILDMDTKWTKAEDGTYVGTDRATGAQKWTGTRADLVFASNSQLRAFAEVYASDDDQARFVDEFVAAWNKVMNADRFDVA